MQCLLGVWLLVFICSVVCFCLLSNFPGTTLPPFVYPFSTTHEQKEVPAAPGLAKGGNCGSHMHFYAGVYVNAKFFFSWRTVSAVISGLHDKSMSGFKETAKVEG